MMNEDNTNVYSFKGNVISELFEKKVDVSAVVFDAYGIKKHQVYLELCICLAINNRMGLLNISKTLTYDQLKYLVCDNVTPFSILIIQEIKQNLLTCLYLVFISDIQPTDQKQVTQTGGYLYDILKNCVCKDLQQYDQYLQGLIDMKDKKSMGEVRAERSGAERSGVERSGAECPEGTRSVMFGGESIFKAECFFRIIKRYVWG